MTAGQEKTTLEKELEVLEHENAVLRRQCAALWDINQLRLQRIAELQDKVKELLIR